MTIREFRGDFYFLSNFYPCTIEFNAWKFPSAEHFYQALKTDDLTERKEIIAAETPGMAKKLGQKATLVKHWETTKFSIMRHVVNCKFSQNDMLAAKLVATGNTPLVEGNNWHDQIWGDCHCDKHRETPGRNALGIILMLQRLSILEEGGFL